MSKTTSPSVTDVPAMQRYELHLDGELAGVLEYREHGDVRDFVHTVVQPGFRGRGLARRLVQGALDDVRDRGGRVRPVCPYVTRFLRDNPEYADVDVRTEAPRDPAG